jgi:hypothetical protein
MQSAVKPLPSVCVRTRYFRFMAAARERWWQANNLDIAQTSFADLEHVLNETGG